MTVIVNDTGFVPDDWPDSVISIDALVADPEETLRALDLPGDSAPDILQRHLNVVTHIRIIIPGFADGRGLTLARHLRRMGFQGRLRACGPLLADQYEMLRRSGFDEVEIPESLGLRQPEADWKARSDWQRPSYQSHLRGPKRGDCHEP